MKIIDLTHFISPDMPVYPGTEGPRFAPANSYERDGFRETLLTMYTHTGTHMDAPAHLFADGKTLDRLPIEQFVGKAVAIDCTDVGEGGQITMAHIHRQQDAARQADFLLFRTGWGLYWGQPAYFGAYPCINEEVVAYLLETGKKGVGLDTIGLDPIADAGLTLHKKLLGNGQVVIIENLHNLDRLGSGLFTLCALPLKHVDADGSPIRAIALLED